MDLICKREVAIKFEDIDIKQQQLYAECKIYLWFRMSPQADEHFIPTVQYYGVEKDKNLMVFDLMGLSLEKLLSNQTGRKFSIKTVLTLAEQMVARLEFCHSRNIIHRDIKPDNFVMQSQEGPGSKKVVLVDYGLAKKYRNSKGQHIAFKEGKLLTGTARYASCNVHLGYEQSRRDDLESLAYIFVYFLNGNLPWMNLDKVAKDVVDKYEQIKIKKLSTGTDVVCQGLPEPFEKYLIYCKQLQFDQDPDYSYLKSLFTGLFKALNFKNDSKLDWSSKLNS